MDCDWNAAANASDNLLRACKNFENRKSVCGKATLNVPRRKRTRSRGTGSLADIPAPKAIIPVANTDACSRPTYTVKGRQLKRRRIPNDSIVAVTACAPPAMSCIATRKRHAEQLARTAAEPNQVPSTAMPSATVSKPPADEIIDRVLNVLDGIQQGYSDDPQAILDLCESALQSVSSNEMSVASHIVNRDQLIKAVRNSSVSTHVTPAESSNPPSSASCRTGTITARIPRGNNAAVKRHLTAAASVKPSSVINRLLYGRQ